MYFKDQDGLTHKTMSESKNQHMLITEPNPYVVYDKSKGMALLPEYSTPNVRVFDDGHVEVPWYGLWAPALTSFISLAVNSWVAYLLYQFFFN